MSLSKLFLKVAMIAVIAVAGSSPAFADSDYNSYADDHDPFKSRTESDA